MLKNILARTGKYWKELDRTLPDHTTMDLTKHWYQIINVWRNIRPEPITTWNHPLAVLDVLELDDQNNGQVAQQKEEILELISESQK